MTLAEKWTVAGVVAGILALALAVVVALFGDELACRDRPGGTCKGTTDSSSSTNSPHASNSPQAQTPPTPSLARPSAIAGNGAGAQVSSPQVIALGSGRMTLYPPVCTTKGVDLDTLQEVASPPDSEFIYRDQSCVQGSGQAFISGLAGVLLTHISSSPGPIPSFGQCIEGLRDRPSTDIQGMSSSGGTLCFKTTAGRIAGVALTSSPDQIVQLQVALWEIH